MLGFFDIFASFILLLGDTWIKGGLLIALFLFLLVKGVTSVFHVPIWFGPVSFFAGVIDLVIGLTMYFSEGYAGIFAHIAAVTGVFMTLKGGMTVLFGLFAR